MRQSNVQQETDPLIPAVKVRLELGGISDVTLWRWEKNGVIPPAVKINKRKYWRSSVIQGLKGPAAGVMPSQAVA